MSARLIALSFLLATPAMAARKVPCADCASCSTALAQPGARVELSGDVTANAPVCIRITGAGADFNGKGHRVVGQGVALRVEADDVSVRAVAIEGGVEVAARRVTLLTTQVSKAAIGVKADPAPDLRLVRSTIEAEKIGVAFGAAADGACPKGSTMRSPGAVFVRSTVRGAQVGIAACEAMPVLHATTVTGNGLGVLLGNPTPVGEGPKGPHDACACAPTLDAVKSDTTLFFSSGCGGCLVHEGWLPEVQSQGHDILKRLTGTENKAAMATYDAFVRRCLPEITDAIGIPGCVPNYGCLANGVVFKRRGDGDRLVRDTNINSAEDMAEFSARCVAAAQEHYDPSAPICVRHALRDATICGNRTDVRGGAGYTESGSACGTVKGPLECARPCPESAKDITLPAEPGAALPAATASATVAAPSQRWWYIGGGVGLALIALIALRRKA